MGLLNPNHLLWGISIAVLLAIYLRSRSRPTIEVSSLLLFEEAAAPVARVRQLRIDPLFWLETAMLAALTLALAGLYVRTTHAAVQGRNRALVFDLAAGMAAREGGATRLDLAKKQALALVNSASERDRFSVIGYALEAQMIHAETANRDAIRSAISSLQAMAVPARRAAQSSALMRARAAGDLEFFADRRPPESIINDSGLGAAFHFHQSGAPAENLAIVSLDPGIVLGSRGRAVIKNFGPKPQTCELAIDSGGGEIYHQTLVLGPREQSMVPFGPLTKGGLVHARILSTDALEADNDSYAYAAVDAPSHVLVLSPDATVRDDLARVLLAVNSNFIIATADPARFKSEEHYALVVMHDCFVAGLHSESTLLVFPPAAAILPGLRVVSTAPGALMTNQGHADAGATPTLLASTRALVVPDWMTVKGHGNAAGAHDTIPLVASGALSTGQFGVVAFDVRDHLLLDPDRLEALVAMVDLVRELTVPTQLRIVSTGTYLAIPVSHEAKATAPDGSNLPASHEEWGRLRIRPLQPGHYTIDSANGRVDVYANYYDAFESDLTALAAPSTPQPKTSARDTQLASIPKQVQPLAALLVIFAVIAIIVESGLLMRKANRWGMRHV